MKRIILLLMFAFVATVYSHAQQIAVVSTDGATSLYQTLGEAINGASAGSVIYLPGGGFPISDDVTISKKLTIIGIGHKINTDNADGYTTITGNLNFDEGSDGSAVMGVYLTGTLIIGYGDKKVDNVLVRYCNLSAVSVRNSQSLGTVVNQNYIRSGAYFNNATCEFTNNIVRYIWKLDNGIIAYNIITSGYGNSDSGVSSGNYAMNGCDNTSVKYNILLRNQNGSSSTYSLYGSNCTAIGNMIINSQISSDSEPIILGNDVSWSDVFVNYNSGTISPNSNFHFKEAYQQYSECGIYGGTGFSDSALPPVPYISAKRIDEQTDAAGNLTIKIRVKAGGEE